MAILEIISQTSSPLSVPELIKKLQLPKATAHRLVQQLQDEGFLLKDPLSKSLLLTNRVESFATSVITNQQQNGIRRRILKNLAEEVGETCNCTCFDGCDLIYLDRVETNWPIKIQLQSGSHLPLNATASGKLFLAYMPKQQLEKIKKILPMQASTENTITDWQAMDKECQKIRKDGFAYDNEELIKGMVAIAIPVFNKQKQIALTIAIHGPTQRVTLAQLEKSKPALKLAANKLLENSLS